MNGLWQLLFGARAQVVVGAVCLFVGALLWSYGWWLIAAGQRERVVDLIFHASMFFGLVACYAIIATGLGYRATERVEAQVADVEHAEEVRADRAEVN